MSESKEKFNFSCTKCGKCCENRGPVPLILADIALWAKNKVIANFMPYLQLYKTPYGLDLVLAKSDTISSDEKKAPADQACPLYNKETKMCNSYAFRPLSCRTYPLEYDGKSYAIVDETCPGIGNGEMTKEARIEMRENAKSMNAQLTQLRIAFPVVTNVMQGFVIREIVEQQKRMMDQMSPEERKKFEEEMKKEAENRKAE